MQHSANVYVASTIDQFVYDIRRFHSLEAAIRTAGSIAHRDGLTAIGTREWVADNGHGLIVVDGSPADLNSGR